MCEALGYIVVLEPEEDGGFHAYVPELKGCHSCGMTVEEALYNIREAIELYLEPDEEQGPPPTTAAP
jgi:predicted RNase H-like HicB family nuclease